MATTVRQSVTLTKPQYDVLRAEAERLGITVSDLVRRIVDEWRAGRGKEDRSSRLAEDGSLNGSDGGPGATERALEAKAS